MNVRRGMNEEGENNAKPSKNKKMEGDEDENGQPSTSKMKL